MAPMKRTQHRTRGQTRLEHLAERRQEAARLFQSREKQADVARLLRVSRQSVSRWYRQWREEGRAVLSRAGRAGRPPKLTDAQLEEVAKRLRLGARAHGFATELWTLQRIAAVVHGVTGVRFHPGHVWRLMGSMGWSLQRPAKRAKERNEAAIRNWIQRTWPRLKKKPAKRRRGSFSRTRAGSHKSHRSVAHGDRRVRRRS